MCVLCVFSLCCHVYRSVIYSIFVTVSHKTNFLVNLYWNNKYCDSDSELSYFAFNNYCLDRCRQRRSIKPTKVDKKFLLFGEKDVEEGQSNTSIKEENHFMASIQRTLREAMDGLTATAEVTATAECLCKHYYRPCPFLCPCLCKTVHF